MFSPIRPNPLEQGGISSGNIISIALMIVPYIAISCLMLNIKLKWIKEQWVIGITPIILLAFLGLDIYNCTVSNISGMGSLLTIGIGYLVVLNVAHNHKEYSDGLMYGVIAGIASLFLWEVIYQVIIYSKAHWTIPDNTTYFYSVLVSIPFLLVLFSGRTRMNKYARVCIGLFILSMVIWALSGFWTYMAYNNGWYTENYTYWGYTMTRFSKIAFCAILATMTYKTWSKNETAHKQSIQPL